MNDTAGGGEEEGVFANFSTCRLFDLLGSWRGVGERREGEEGGL